MTRLRTDLEEAGCSEVLVEGESLAEAAVAHHLEAGRIDERITPFIVFPQPGPGFVFLVVGDAMDGEFGLSFEGADPVQEGEAAAMSVLATEKRPGLSQHQIGREYLFGRCEVSEHGQRFGMSPVAGKGPGNPPTGVGEFHES